MPTETDVKLAADLADFRVEVERRFGQVTQQLSELREDFAGFRGAVQTELGFIRKLGDRFLGIGVAIVGTMILGAASIAWAASTVVSDVRHHGERIDKVEAQLETTGKRIDRIDDRLETMGKQLETLLSRTASKNGG